MSNPEWDNYDPDSDTKKIAKLQERIAKAVKELLNVQPHIAQACLKGHEIFIDSHIDMALEHLTGTPHRQGTPL
jgi:hypothetical protein